MVKFNSLDTLAVAASFIVPLIGPSHSLSNFQLLETVFIHLPFGQQEADKSGGEADHPKQEAREKMHVVIKTMLSPQDK